MKSYLNNSQLKEAFVAEVKKHRETDAIVQGTYGKKNGAWKGCAVACSLRSLAILNGEKLKTEYNEHGRYEELLGIPEWLAHLEDAIFEGLPEEEAKVWPEQFAEAVPVGVDLEPVKWKFCAYLMKENIERVLALNIPEDTKKKAVDAIRQVIAVHEDAIKTGKWDEDAARLAAAASAAAKAVAAKAVAASAAKASAAWSASAAAASASASEAWSAAKAAAAESAAWSAAKAAAAWSAAKAAAAESEAWSAAKAAEVRSVTYQRYAEELLRLIREEK